MYIASMVAITVVITVAIITGICLSLDRSAEEHDRHRHHH
jgi:hypothetical protein